MRGILIVLSVALVLIAGIPVWFRLTRIYRPSLPRERVTELRKRLSAEVVKIPINYTIWILEPSNTKNDSVWEKFFESISLLGQDSRMMSLEMRLVLVKETECVLNPLHTRTSTAKFDCPFSRGDLVHAATSVSSEEFDALLDEAIGSTSGNYHLFVLPPDVKSAGAVVGIHRHSWIIPSSTDQMEVEVVGFSDYLQQEVYSSVVNVDNQLIRASSDILLSFTLCNSDVTHGYWHWNFARFESEWLKNTIQQLSHILHITIESQVIYDCDITVQPEWSKDLSKFILKESQLAFFVNQEWDVDPTNIIRPESKIVSSSSSLASIPHVLHFMVHIPPVNLSPLTIESTEGQSQTFWIPSWGGVVILNKDYPTNNQAPVQQGELKEDDYQLFAESFVSQLRMLAGFSAKEVQSSQIKVLSSLDRAFADFEIDGILKTKIEFNVKKTVHILNAFIQLVDKIPNLEVPDSIQQQVLDAVEAMEQGLGLFETTGCLIEANDVVYKALIAAEAAFSHPSIVSIENFPDEHKLGIYLPLFLPVLITMILLILQETRKALIKRY